MLHEMREAVAEAEALVGWGGSIKMIEAPRLCGAVDLITCATRPAGPSDASNWSNVPAGSGVGLSWEDALVSTVGETIERLGLFPDPEMQRRLTTAPSTALGEAAVNPRDFNFYRDEFYGENGFPPRPFSAKEPIAWFPARGLTEPRDLWIPAEYVFFSSEGIPNHHWSCTTSGVACHRSKERALTSALCELVERDAFVEAWLRAEPLPAVAPAAFGDAGIDEIVERAARAGVALHLRELDGAVGIPAYLAVAEAQDGCEPAIGLGAAAHLVGVDAARKALLESVHTWNWALLKIDRQGFLDSSCDPTQHPLREFADHVYLYSHRWMKTRVAFLLDATRRSQPPSDSARTDPAGALREVLSRVESAGLDAMAVDQTPYEMAERGYCVLRAVVPGLLPLQPGRRIQGLRSDRLPALRNPDPHPFP